VPSPMVRPSSYLPTRLFTLVVLIPCLTAFLKSVSGGFYTQPSGFTVLWGELYRDCHTTACDENDHKLILTFFLRINFGWPLISRIELQVEFVL
jgi:hypothetical protein